MSGRINFEERIIRREREVLRAGDYVRGEVVEDRTLIDLHTLRREYKLAQAYANVRNLEYRSVEAVRLQEFLDYRRIRGAVFELGFNAVQKPRPSYPADEAYRNVKTPLHYPHGDILVLVDSDVYNAVSNGVNQYVLDVGRDGFWATVHVINGGKPADVRSYILSQSPRPKGVLMVGAIPAAWFELHDDFHNAHTEFPCDLYYMDTGATWNDPDGDGKFDDWSGTMNPEIWVGRLWTPTSGGNDAALINDYFARNHKFRLGMLGHSRNAMAYVDDDWQSFDDCALDSQFNPSEITKYTNPGMTDADLYKAEVNSLRSWVQLCAHSWTQGHSFTVGSTNEYINMAYFRDTNPPNAHFYNLFCCGPGRFTSADYLAGWYVFDKTGGGMNLGVCAVASSKSGSMLFFEDFYTPLGQGKTVGESFVEWWKARGPSHELWERRWFYGLVLLGDPTLTWWKGAVPQLEQPQREDVFDHYPRKMQFRWDPVNIPGAKYTVEVDAYGAVNAGKWAEETGQTFRVYHNVYGNMFDHSFVGAQRGRWRVCARVDNKTCAWSPWSYFRFTI
jgi:hypothetical protein